MRKIRICLIRKDEKNMERMEYVKALRADPSVHYNCCQAVVMGFAEESGMTPEQANALGEHFGAGMRLGSVCGALTGALMALGMMGKPEADAAKLRKRFKEEAGAMDCVDLLKAAKENGEEKKHHCDRMVFLAAKLAEEIAGVPGTCGKTDIE